MSLVSLLQENAYQIAEAAVRMLEETNIKGYTALGPSQLLMQTQKKLICLFTPSIPVRTVILSIT